MVSLVQYHQLTYSLAYFSKLTSLPICGFIAQLVEQRTGNAEVTGSNPVEALIFFFSGFFFPIALIGKFTAMISIKEVWLYFSIKKPNQFLDWKVSILKVLLTNRPLYTTDVDTNVIYKIELSNISFEFIYSYFVANQN